MAKFISGPLVGEIRNALGAQVFTRGAHGPFTRSRVTPDTTTSERRDTTQAIFAGVAERWNFNLTDSQRRAWHEWAMSALASKSPLTPKTIVGRAAFWRINQRLGLYGADYLDDPPWEQQVTQIKSISLAADADAQSLLLSFAPAPLPASHAMVVECSPNMSLGRMFCADKTLFLCYLDPGATSPVSLAPAWLTRMWPSATPHTPSLQTIQPAKKIFTRCRLLNLTNGAYSGNQTALATATGTGDAMLTRTTQLSQADILSLKATPVNLVPPPGLAKTIIPISMLGKLHFGTTPYTPPSGSPMFPTYIGPQDYALQNIDAFSYTIQGSSILDNTADTIFQGFAPPDSGSQLANITENQGLWITHNGDTEYTNGDSTLTILICYAIADLT